ncbi:hypothetical protein [Streptomyces xiaopingdaonensis]|uniref:hypothetical protein n=1 Tax=Streptomyces xiaopingdaonensis TaxID=1565415 RepID=UPI00068017D4|nr:hypothetical protein [Streptomyces xiaopingdaonensis]
MSTKLSTLTTAAQAWEDMADEFEDQETAYRRDVHGISLGRTWFGHSAVAGNEQFNGTLKQFKYAQTEAKAIAELLREAASQFHDLREDLKGVKKDAEKDDMIVSARGVVTFDTESLSEGGKTALHHDPSYQESVRDKERTWQRRIDAAVKKVTDADQGVETALEQASRSDSPAGGFNGKAQGDIEKYEAKNTAEIATRINNGEATPADIREAQRAFRDNAGDKAFSQTLLNSLGPDGMVKFTNKLSDLSHSGDKGDRKDYAGLQKSLANTLATATKDTDSDFYKNWRKKMRKAGTEQFDLDVVSKESTGRPGDTQQARGYQSLATLMKQGSGYSDDFLHDMADDIRKAEDKSQGGDPDIWDLHGNYSGKDDGWFANDPLDGVLEVMSRDPKASETYLDPGADRSNDNLEYLINDRDWKNIDETTYKGEFRMDKPTHDDDARKGFGLALEAGATGNEPGSGSNEFGRHSEAQARIMHDAVNTLDYGQPEGKQGEDDIGKADERLAEDGYKSMREPLARALADYSPDTFDSLTGEGRGKQDGSTTPYLNGENSQTLNSRESLVRMMRGASEDSTENFELLNQAQRGYASSEYMGTGTESSLEADNRGRKVGEVFGALNAVAADANLDVSDSKIEKAEDTKLYGYHAGGGAITGIPVVGDTAQRIVDASLSEWQKSVIEEQEAIAKESLSSTNSAAERALQDYFEAWADEHDVPKDMREHASGEAKQSYHVGRNNALEALRGEG